MNTEYYISQLGQLAPKSVSVIQALTQKGILHAPSRETTVSAAENLCQVLTTPRASGLNPLDVFWSLLERLYNPYTNTQKISVPFADGSKNAITCVGASRISILISKYPGEYVRIIQELTRLETSFVVTRWYRDPQLFQAKMRWLQGIFPYHIVGNRTLTIAIAPDDNALPRAFVEQQNRWYLEYDFGQRHKKNSRGAIDVLLQSAITNYALRGQYDSAIDADRTDGVKGVPFGSFGYLSLDYDILGQETSYVAGPAARQENWPFPKPRSNSPLDAPDVP
jgi:hypothetical protein